MTRLTLTTRWRVRLAKLLGASVYGPYKHGVWYAHITNLDKLTRTVILSILKEN